MDYDWGSPWTYTILAGTTLFTLALLPQLIRTLKLGRADDFSAPFVLLVIIASMCNLTYFYAHTQDYIAGTGFIANIVVWSIVLWYRLRPRQT